MRIALLTYSTRPRGGVVHTLALAEALVDAGAEVDVWTLGRGGDTTFFRPVAAGVGVRAVPFDSPHPDVGVRIVESIEALRAWCKERLAVYKIPRTLHATSELPRNAMGKVTKKAVQQMFTA